MKKSVKSIFTALLIIFLLVVPLKAKALTLTEVFEGGNQFLEGASGDQIFDEQKEEEAVTSIYWIAVGIAIAVAVIIGIVLGIQFITAGVSGQAKVKEKLVPYGVGCVVALGAFGIWGFAMTIAKSIFN